MCGCQCRPCARGSHGTGAGGSRGRCEPGSTGGKCGRTERGGAAAAGGGGGPQYCGALRRVCAARGCQTVSRVTAAASSFRWLPGRVAGREGSGCKRRGARGGRRRQNGVMKSELQGRSNVAACRAADQVIMQLPVAFFRMEEGHWAMQLLRGCMKQGGGRDVMSCACAWLRDAQCGYLYHAEVKGVRRRGRGRC